MKLHDVFPRLVCVLVLSVAVAVPLRAQGDATPTVEPVSNFSQVLGFSKHLRLEPKTITSPDGTSSTVGLGYAYKRCFSDISQGGDIDLYFESLGFLAADEDESADRQLDHKLRLSLIDFLSDKRRQDYAWFNEPGSNTHWRRLQNPLRIYNDSQLERVRHLYRTYQTEPDPAQKQKIFEEAKAAWPKRMGTELTTDDNGFWPELDAVEGSWMKDQEEFKAGVTKPWLSLEVNAGAESDQDFSDVQYVGGARLYGKWQLLGTPVDFLCRSIRGYDHVNNFLNHQGGPYLWTGFDFVDAHENEGRNAVTGGDDDNFGRFNAGVFYRNELFSFGDGPDAEAVSLEFNWDFYAELDAPDSIEAADSDTTSYVRAALVFDNGVFLEYKDGRKPIDIDDSSALSLGWRFGM